MYKGKRKGKLKHIKIRRESLFRKIRVIVFPPNNNHHTLLTFFTHRYERRAKGKLDKFL